MPVVISLAKLVVRRPREAYYRFGAEMEQVRFAERDREAAREPYEVEEDWEARFGDLGLPRDVDDRDFDRVWAQMERELGVLRIESNDADPGFAKAVWCAIKARGAERVVETGVGRGVSSRIALEAMPSDSAHLWSVDLPLLNAEWAGQSGRAVAASLRPRWTYIRGATKRVLPKLLRELREIDVFVQDSAGTSPTAGFEFESAWHALAPGGFLVADGIDRSPAFARFVDRVQPQFSLVGRLSEAGGGGLFGIARR